MRIFSINGEYDLILFAACLVLVQGVGFVSSMLSGNIRAKYKNLKKPKFSPPAIVFPIVWIILYTLMAYSLYRIFFLGSRGLDVKTGLMYFYIQLFLNFLWSILFFRFEKRALAFIEILVLIVFIALTIVTFYSYDKIASFVLIPYLIWCIYAAILNFIIYIKNKKNNKK